MDWRAPHLPPLLRGLGTSLLLVASVAVGLVEYRQAAQRQLALEQARQRVEVEAANSLANGQVGALTEEVRRLRKQLQESDLAGQVFENPWFQGLGALGTLLLAASFFVEAAQRWPRRPPDTA